MKESGKTFSDIATRLKKEKTSLETLIVEEATQLAKSYDVLVLPENLDMITDRYVGGSLVRNSADRRLRLWPWSNRPDLSEKINKKLLAHSFLLDYILHYIRGCTS